MDLGYAAVLNGAKDSGVSITIDTAVLRSLAKDIKATGDSGGIRHIPMDSGVSWYYSYSQEEIPYPEFVTLFGVFSVQEYPDFIITAIFIDAEGTLYYTRDMVFEEKTYAEKTTGIGGGDSTFSGEGGDASGAS